MICKTCNDDSLVHEECWKCRIARIEKEFKDAGLKFEWPDQAIDEALKDLDINGEWIDEGIGPYEYGSIKEIHHAWVYQVKEDKGFITVEWVSNVSEVVEETSINYTVKNQYSENHRRRKIPDSYELEIKAKLESAGIERCIKNKLNYYKIKATYSWSTK